MGVIFGMNKFLVYFSLTTGCMLLNATAQAATFTVSASFDQSLPIPLQQDTVTANVDFNRTFDSIDMICFTPFFQNDLDPGESFSIGPFPTANGFTSFGWNNIGNTPVSSRRVCGMGAEIQAFMDGFEPTGIRMSNGDATLTGLEVEITGEATPMPNSPLPVFFDPNMQACFDDLVMQNGWMSAEEVDSIDCANRGIQAIGNLGQLPNLAALNLSNNPLEALDVSGLESTLKRLDLSNTKLYNLFDLQNLSALTELRLNHVNYQMDSFTIESQLQQIIASNPNITSVGISGVQLNDPFSFFMQLSPQIVALELSDTGLQVPPVALDQFPQLQHLDLSDNPLEGLGPIFGLENQLISLNLNNTRLYDLGEIANFKALQKVQLNNIRFSNPDPMVSQQAGERVQQLVMNNPGLTHLAINGIQINDPFMFFNSLSSQITALALSNTGLNGTIPITQFPQLTQLDVSNNPLEFLGPLQGLENQLTSLDVSGTNLKDLGDIVVLSNLDTLRLNDINFSMADPMMVDMQVREIVSRNPQLTALGLNGIRLNDPDSFFFSLPAGITELSMRDTGITNVPNLDQFSALTALDLSNNPLEWIGPLQGLANQLTALNLSGTSLFGLSELMDLTALKSLHLNDINFMPGVTDPMYSQELSQAVQDLVANNPGLTELGLNGIKIQDAFMLFDKLPEQIEVLSLSNTGLTTLPMPVDQFTQLSALDLSGNPIDWIGTLQGLENQLTSLNLSNTKLYDLNDLNTLKALESLQINDIEFVSQDPMLDNQVQQILMNNPRLTQLGMNGITINDSFSFFNTLSPQMRALSVSNTGLSQIPMPLAQFSQLESVDLSHNPIAWVGPLQGLEMQLKSLDLSHTVLESLNDIVNLRALETLRLNNIPLDMQDPVMTNDQLFQVLSNNPGLEHISISGITLMDPVMFFNTVSPTIKTLELSNTGLNFLPMTSTPFSELTHLDVSNNPITDLPILQGLEQRLRTLDVSNTNLFSLSELMNLQALKALRLNDMNLDPMTMPESDLQIIVSNNPGLSHLGINGMILPDYMMLLNVLPPSLTTLEMQNTGVEVFSAQLDALTDLDLSFNGGLVDVNLGMLPSLTTLSLVGNTHMPCDHLDFLENQRPEMNLIRPSECAALPPIAPSNLRVTASTDSSISLAWNDLSDTETSFELQRSADGINWANLATLGQNVQSYTDTNLTPSTGYFYRVRALNTSGASNFSNEILEMTAPANIPEYCAAKGTYTNYEWINAVTVNGVQITSGNNYGYRDNTNMTLTARAGATTLITLTPGFRWGAYTERWSVWVDFNNDGIFQSSEQVVQRSASSAINTSFVVPPDARGNLRMRVAMRWGSSPSACGTFTWGEVEDFTLQIQ